MVLRQEVDFLVKKRMFNILDFIDSPDIREYNKNTEFTPAEQAILITQSCGTTLEEKINALQELVDTYDAEGFQTDSILCSRGDEEKIKFRQIVISEIQDWKKALEVREDSEHVVFIACYKYTEESRYDDNVSYFSTYKLAYEYLQARKQEDLDDPDYAKEESFAYIKRMFLDCEASYDDAYYFDNQLRLIQVLPAVYRGNDPEVQEMGIEDFYMHVPLPFKKGDYIKVKNPFWETVYGVMSHDSPTKENDFHMRRGWADSSDMITTIDIYKEDSHNHKFDYTDDTSVLFKNLSNILVSS